VSATLRALRTSQEAIASGAASAVAAVRSALSSGSYTAQQVRYLRAELQGYLDDARTVRASLDLLEVEGEQVVDDAEDTLHLLRWERESRHALQALGAAIRRAREALETLETGATRTVHLARSGDTLQRIAARYLGDWREWPRLLDANPDLAPGAVVGGTVVVIPERR